MSRSEVPLLLLTDHYPFETGEEFLEQEIGYLASRFEAIVVVPMRSRVGATQTRSLPEGVTAMALDLPAEHTWKKRLVRHLGSLLFGPCRLELRAKHLNPRAVMAELHFAVDVADRLEVLRGSSLYGERLAGRPLLVYSYWLHRGSGVAVALKHLHRAPIAAVSRAHAYDVDEADRPDGHLPWRRRLVAELDEIYPISRYARSFLVPYKRGERGARLEIRHLGTPAITQTSALAGESGARDGVIRLVSLSHMAPYKRVDRLADAVGALTAMGRSVEWTHIGESDPRRREIMLEYARTIAPSAVVNFLGYQPNETVPHILRDGGFTVFVNASDGEGVPVSIMEAMAAGLPVVATDVGGTSEIVHHGENGFLVPAGCTGEQLSDAVLAVVDLSAEERALMVGAARTTWATEFCADEQYSDMADHLAELAKGLETE